MVPWIALVARRGMTPEVSGKLSRALKDTVADPAVAAELQQKGLDVAFEPGAVYDARVARELPLLRAYVHRAGIPVQ
jgi:tripartite-type tricarboxylate transporter receptor subunit TctC